MASRFFDIGDKPVYTATFKDTSDVLTSPSTVVFIWRTPDGTETTYTSGVDSEVANPSTGVFTFAAPTIATVGPHYCRAKGTAGLIAAAEYAIAARRSSFSNP